MGELFVEKPLEKIAIIGAGAFGIALAKTLALSVEKIIIYGRNIELINILNCEHRHPKTLSSLKLPAQVMASTDLDLTIDKAALIFLCVPMQAYPELLTKLKASMKHRSIIISTAKGIAVDDLSLACDQIDKIMPSEIAKIACYLSGPSFASDLAEGLPCGLSLASKSSGSRNFVEKALSQANFRLYPSSDVLGVCVGGAFKNVVAIACGAASQLKLGLSARALLLTRGLQEITLLALKMGAKRNTLNGLSGLGDLLLTCTDEMSRNFRLGSLIAQSNDLNEALSHIGTVVEGAKTAQTIVRITKKYDIDLPICKAVYRMLYEAYPSEKALGDLLG
jgi:glycerol-3-phosphate dehydrogenase (NAD(P)+)